MKREILTTADGSVTIHLPEWEESYHSKHGAIQEARHVFLQNGLHEMPHKQLRILEIGFGTGLNAFLTLLEGQQRDLKIWYTGVEAYPISGEEVRLLNYAEAAKADAATLERMHALSWEQQHALTENFHLCKRRQFFHNIDDVAAFDLIYFDAFGFRVQPDLWSAGIFQKMYDALLPGGLLVTYAARTVIKRNMEAAGFRVEKCAGPPGKREMMRAFKGALEV